MHISNYKLCRILNEGSESRYMNLGTRLYDQIIGRFLSADPLWEAFPSWSPYQYAYNSTISYKDPTGLAPQKEKGNGYEIFKL